MKHIARVFLQSYSSSLYCEILQLPLLLISGKWNRAVIVVTAGRSDGAGNDI